MLMKCRLMGLRPKALIRLSGAQVFPMITLDVTGDFLMTRVFVSTSFHTVLPVSRKCIFSEGNSVTAAQKVELHPQSQTLSYYSI